MSFAGCNFGDEGLFFLAESLAYNQVRVLQLAMSGLFIIRIAFFYVLVIHFASVILLSL
jgi:hypothetical protein